MSDIEKLLGYAGQLSEAAERSKASAAQQHIYINGDDRTDLETESGPVPTLAKQARQYAEAIPDAVVDLSRKMADGKIHDSVSEGRRVVADGVYYYVRSPNPLIGRSLYRRVDANTSEYVVDDPSLKAVDLVLNRMSDDKPFVFGLSDDAGFLPFEVMHNAIRTRDLEVSTVGLRLGDESLVKIDVYSYAVMDENWFVASAVTNDGRSVGDNAAEIGFSAEEVNKANQLGLASSASVTREYNTEVARPIWDNNHLIEYGQSLSTGFEGWPALSKVPRLGNKMLGNSVRPAGRVAGAFTPVGAPVLMPLKGVVQNLDDASIILTDAEVAALPPGIGNEGETTIIGMTNFAKKLHNQGRQVANDEAKVFVASCCGVSGQPIERLIKGDSTNRWLRLPQAAQKVKELSTAAGKTYGVIGVAFLQGEYNYSENWGGVDTKDGYKEKLAQLYSDVESDVVSAIAGQDQPPLFMTYQTGAAYTRDHNNLAIGMAQWELAEERPNWVMATPVYPYPDKGGHLTANGYRWVGKQFAKVWHRVVGLGQNWKPLSPLNAQVKKREALITFHVPHPPLAFGKPVVGRMPTDYAAKGFSAVDTSGDLPVVAVSIVADCVVRLLFARDPVGSVFIRYADRTIHGGNGCLHDSDPAVSDDFYEYSPGSGQYADENISELVGKPYPLQNWCIAFHIAAIGA
jgi:hypothetical protein